MSAEVLIMDGINAVVLALTPMERWNAARLRRGPWTGELFVTFAVVALVILTVMFVVVTYSRIREQRRAHSRVFHGYAERRGLSPQEERTLQEIAKRSGLRQSEVIFTAADAFDRGATKLLEDTALKGRSSEAAANLHTELSALRQKLGFKQRVGAPANSRKPSTREIPVGKKLHITRRKARNSTPIESTVIKNDDTELAVRLPIPLASVPGEVWRVHYYSGASVWEFDTSVVNCYDEVLVLNHSDNVRFVNRRRFQRVSVNRPAFIARFPFARTLPIDSQSAKQVSKGEEGLPGVAESSWGPPEFVPAVVTELAGPGLRIEHIEAPLELKVGERVLVVFKLNEEKQKDSDSQGAGESVAPRIVEDIGQVKHSRAIEQGWSIAVELMGLSDSDVNELIRAANTASSKAATAAQNKTDRAGEEETAESTMVTKGA